MANVRDSDTSLWLHNKLGTSGDLWSGGSICSQLTQDVLRNIKDCFIDLQAQVKLKLLLSFLHIPRRNVEEWKSEMEEILELAVVDSDQWVSMLAELLKSYPATGTINMEIEENARLFTDLLTDLKKMVKKHCDQGMMPMECLYLNKNALGAVVGQPAVTAKHFTLKRKPKSAALRAELLQKSSDAANNLKKNSLSGGPIRSRGIAKRMEDTTPLKGFPSRSPLSNFRSPGGIRQLVSTPTLPARSLPKTPAGRKDGGIKLLEITEQPIGFGREAKRRKKMAEEGNEAIKKEKDAGASPTAATTPEYAAGLVSSTIAPQLSTPSTLGATFVSPPSVGPPPTPAVSLVASVSASPLNSAIGTTVTVSTPLSAMSIQARENLQNSLQSQATRIQATTGGATVVAAPPSASVATTTATVVVGAAPSQLRLVTTGVMSATATLQVPPVVAQAVAAPPKKGLSLTREQMQEAQEMFRTANKVTRPEKALILGFMAGARDNPCPHLGNVVTIKLSENQEPVTQTDGGVVNMMVEVHFQMNYNTGEWKRVKKLRKIEE